jgi:hypothetical protein
MDEPDDHNEYDNAGCPCCDGEGFVFECFDGFCEDCDIGCDDCTRPCPECTPRQRGPSDELRQVLADALSSREDKK